jgi:glucose-6-phosphate dehydrogenase assembly protein OpcA
MDALSQFLTPTTSTNTTSSDDLAHFFGDEPQAPEETKAPEVKAKTKAKAKAKTKVAAPLKVEDERRTEIADEWIDSDAHATTYKQFVEYINTHVVGDQAQMACTAILLGAAPQAPVKVMWHAWWQTFSKELTRASYSSQLIHLLSKFLAQ